VKSKFPVYWDPLVLSGLTLCGQSWATASTTPCCWRSFVQRQIALFAWIKLSDDFCFSYLRSCWIILLPVVRCNLMQSSRLHIPRDSSHTWAPRSVWALSVWPLGYQQEWHCNCDISQNTSTFCVYRLLSLLFEVLYSCLMKVGPQHNKYTVVLDRKGERLVVDIENPTGWQSSYYTFFLPLSHQERPASSHLVSLSSRHASTVPRFLDPTACFSCRPTKLNLRKQCPCFKSTKLQFEIVNFSIYQKSIRSGPCFKPLLSPFWSLLFNFYNSNIRRTSGQDLGAF
jgi:hypothetical protein